MLIGYEIEFAQARQARVVIATAATFPAVPSPAALTLTRPHRVQLVFGRILGLQIEYLFSEWLPMILAVKGAVHATDLQLGTALWCARCAGSAVLTPVPAPLQRASATSRSLE